jgi:hypothetical protein
VFGARQRVLGTAPDDCGLGRGMRLGGVKLEASGV